MSPFPSNLQPPPRKKRAPAEPPRSHLVFVYGTLKSGFRNHGYLHDNDAPSVRIDRGGAETSEKYPMFARSIPYVLYHPGAGHHIRGELWKVSSQTLLILDRLEGHPDAYECRLITACANNERHQAWLYFWSHWPSFREFRRLTLISEFSHAQIPRL